MSRVEGVRTWLYLACLAAVGGGAILHLLRSLWLPIPYVPMVSSFEEPVAAFIHVLGLKLFVAQFGVLRTLEGLLSLAAALSIAALAFRRANLMRQSARVSAPSSFSGFLLGLAWAALALLPVLLVLWSMAFPVDRGGAFVVFNVFLVFVLAELTDFRESRRHAARSHTQIPGPAAEVLRRRPAWTFLAIAFPVLGAVIMVLLLQTVGMSLGTLAVGGIALTALCALGLAATVIAVARRERWVPAQAIGFVVNFGVTAALGLPALADVFRFG